MQENLVLQQNMRFMLVVPGCMKVTYQYYGVIKILYRAFYFRMSIENKVYENCLPTYEKIIEEKYQLFGKC